MTARRHYDSRLKAQVALDRVFTGGTGHTDGLVGFGALYAEFEFSGKVTVPK